MEQHIRLRCLDSNITAVEYGGESWAVERGHVVLPVNAAPALTAQPGAAFTHILDAPRVVRKAVVTELQFKPVEPVRGEVDQYGRKKNRR